MTLHEAAARYYEDHGWPVTPMADGAGFAVHGEGSVGAWTALVLADDASMRFVFYSLSPVDVEPDRLAAVAEFCHRANHGLVGDAFELDHDDGEVRLRSGIELFDLPASLRTDELYTFLVADLSASNVGTFDRYLPGLVAVATTGVDPARVVAELEAAGV